MVLAVHAPDESSERLARIDVRPAYAAVALWYVAAWTLITIIWTVQWGLESSFQGPVNWPKTFGLSALNWYTSAVVSVPLAWLAWHRRVDSGPLYRSIVIGVIAIAAAAVARFSIFVPLHNTFFGSSYDLREELRIGFIPEAVGLVTVVAIVLTIRYYGTARERELRAVQLQNQLSKAQLEALQAQLHPHFLFNTLHCISALMHRNVEDADEMLVRLCDLLRVTLQRPRRAEITLEDELVMLERYLSIMELRFPNRVRVSIDVPLELRTMVVPALLLQPLVENVLQHGLDESGGATEVLVSVARANEILTLRVLDNGRGPVRNTTGFGLGLENTRRRLQTLYRGEASLQIRAVEPSGTEVSLSVPCRT